MTELLHKKCVPCEGGEKPLAELQAAEFLKQIKNWQLQFTPPPPRISKTFTMKNFREVMAFLNKVAALAEEQGHHPDIEAHYRELTISFTTHAIQGLSENDFIMAAKIDQISST